MSKIEKRETRIINEIIGYKCDVCGKESKGINDQTFYNFMARHYAWGNDSIESVEYYDVCSVECFKKQLIYCINELEEYKGQGAEINGMTVDFAKELVDKIKIS